LDLVAKLGGHDSRDGQGDDVGDDGDAERVEEDQLQQGQVQERDVRRRHPGTIVMIFKIFSPKNLAKILAFYAQTTASFCKNLIITLVFEKNANFFAENCQKSQRIVIITSTPENQSPVLRTKLCLTSKVRPKLGRLAQ
jgi:hypothetical protein